jgi:hypothetical protein
MSLSRNNLVFSEISFSHAAIYKSVMMDHVKNCNFEQVFCLFENISIC